MFNFHFQDGMQPLACDLAAISKIYDGAGPTLINRRCLNDEIGTPARAIAATQATVGSWVCEKPSKLRWLYLRIATCTGVA